MTYIGALIATLVVVAVLLVVLYAPVYLYRERPRPAPPAPAREGYGQPPGNVRAITHDELGYRGWADAPPAYQGRTASSTSHVIERSA